MTDCFAIRFYQNVKGRLCSHFMRGAFLQVSVSADYFFIVFLLGGIANIATIAGVFFVLHFSVNPTGHTLVIG